jgi:L-seryl-tRNA(Ser) seleniumtransferase
LRVDKLTIAALEGTLAHYLKNNPAEEIPVLNMITSPRALLKNKATDLASSILETIKDWERPPEIEILEVVDRIGGGAYPMAELPGYAVSLFTGDAFHFADILRRLDPPVLTRIQDQKVLFSVRTLREDDVRELPTLVKRGLEELKR